MFVVPLGPPFNFWILFGQLIILSSILKDNLCQWSDSLKFWFELKNFSRKVHWRGEFISKHDRSVNFYW
jgi:hypothetical protein